MASDTTDLTGTIVQPSLNKFTKFANHLAQRASLDADEIDTLDTQASIANRILDAKTEQEIWDADEGGTPGGRDLIDLEQRIFGFDIMKGKDPEKESKLLGPVFLLVRAARLTDGMEFTWNTAASGIVTKLYKFDQLGKFANGGYIDCVIREAGGKGALVLRPVSSRAIS
jgi:hypothetical protein